MKKAVCILCLATLIAGCSSSTSAPQAAPEQLSSRDRAMLAARAADDLAYSRLTGFLSDYSKLTPNKNPQLSGTYNYINPVKKLGRYKVVLLEPITVQLKFPEYADPAQLMEVNHLAGLLETEIKRALGDSIMTASEPGYGVMRLRIALTDTQPNSPMLGRYRTNDPNHPGFGGAAIETEILDSMTGEQLAAQIDWRQGKLKNLVGFFSELDSAEESLQEWAQLLKDAIDDSRGLHRGFGLNESPNIFD